MERVLSLTAVVDFAVHVSAKGRNCFLVWLVIPRHFLINLVLATDKALRALVLDPEIKTEINDNSSWIGLLLTALAIAKQRKREKR